MYTTQVKVEEVKKGKFSLYKEEGEIGFMKFYIKDDILKAYDTEIDEKYRGEGLGKHLMAALMDYAMANDLKVIPKCPYIKIQFDRHPEIYDRIRAEEEE